MSSIAKNIPKSKPTPKLRPFSWWSLDIAEDLDLIKKLTAVEGGSNREQRDAFAVLVWAHLLENDPAWVEAEVKAGRADDHAREFKMNPESLLLIPDLPKLVADFEKLLSDDRVSGMIEE